MDKHLAPLFLLEILKTHSSEETPLRQAELAKYLEEDYDVILERKAVSRNVELLCGCYPEVRKNGKGVFYSADKSEQLLGDYELRLLIDSVLSSKYISTTHSRDLIDRLASLSDPAFRKRIRYVSDIRDWSKTENGAMFYSIDVISDALDEERQIRFDYNDYGIDKHLHVKGSFTVNPYHLVFTGGRYYLLGTVKGRRTVSHFRLDLITNVVSLRTPRAPMEGLLPADGGWADYIEAHPYMLPGASVRAGMLVRSDAIGRVIDAFGKNVTVTRHGSLDTAESVHVSLRASEEDLLRWCLQNADAVELLSPASLRTKVCLTTAALSRKYLSGEYVFIPAEGDAEEGE